MTLKELRAASGKTAKQVADKLGVSVNALYQYENGRREIRLEYVLVLAELYDCTEREVIEAALGGMNDV